MEALKAREKAKALAKIEELKKVPKERKPKPIHLHLQHISRSGLVSISFN